MISLKTSAAKWAKTVSKFGPKLLLLSLLAPTVSGAAVKSDEGYKGKILSLVTYFDSAKGEVFNWWAENQNPGELSRTVLAQGEFLSANNYIDTEKEKKDVPAELRKTDLNSIDKLQLAKMFGAGLIIEGDVNFSKSPLLENGQRLKIHLNAKGLHGETSELVRVLDLYPHEVEALRFSSENALAAVFREVVGRLSDKKIEKPSSVQLVVTGKMSQAQLDFFKKQLQASIKGLTGIHESSIENEQIALNLDYAGAGTKQLRASLERMEWREFRTQVVSHDDERVFFDVKLKEKIN